MTVWVAQWTEYVSDEWPRALAVAGLLLGVAVLLPRLQRMGRRKVAWFALLPAGGELQWAEFRHVAAHTRRRVGNGMVLVARVGSSQGGCDVWIGIAGSKHPQRTAQSMARAAGAHLGPESPPPWPDVGVWRWKLGYTEPAPSRREPDATEVYLRAVDEQTIPERPLFPDVCADHVEPGDVFVALCRPASAPTRVQAACLTTSSGLDMSFTEAAELRRGWLWPGPSALAAAAGCSLAVWTGAAAGGLAAGFALAVALCGGWVLWRRVSAPGVLDLLWAGRIPRLPRRAARGKLLPVWQIGEWVAGDALTGTSAPMRPAPAQALGVDGASVGVDSTGQECRLPDPLRYRGVIAYGDPGSGKTTFLLNLLAHDARRRAEGAHVAVFWIETKGEGAERASQVMNSHGATTLMLMGSRPSGPRLELVDRSRPAEAGRLLTEAIRYAFEADDIHQASADVLASALEAAAVFPSDAAADIGVVGGSQPNMIHVALRLLGGVPEEFKATKRVLAGAVPKQHRASVERYYSRRDFEFERLVEPARNKLRDLSSVAGLFDSSGGRPQITWRELLDAAQPTVLNLGRTAADPTAENGAGAFMPDTDSGPDGMNGTAGPGPADSMYTETTAQRAAAMAMFVLWHTIQEHCDDWQAHDRQVAIYSDELRDISGFGKHGLEVVQAMADQGRSRGVLSAFGTQRPDQLHPSTRTAVDSFATQAYFRLRAVEAAEAASAQLFEAYTPEQISALPKGWCAMSLAAEGVNPAAFTLNPRHIG